MSRPNETASRPSTYGSPPSAIFSTPNPSETAVSDGLAGSSTAYVTAVKDDEGSAVVCDPVSRPSGMSLDTSPHSMLNPAARETLYARRHPHPSHQVSRSSSPSPIPTKSMLSISTAHLPASRNPHTVPQYGRPSYRRQISDHSSSEEGSAESLPSPSEASTPTNAISPSTFAFSPSERTGTTLSHSGITSGATTAAVFTPMTSADLPAHTAKVSKGVFRHFQLEKLSGNGSSMRPRLLRSVSEDTYTATIPSYLGAPSALAPSLACRSYSAIPSPSNTSRTKTNASPGFFTEDPEAKPWPIASERLQPALAIRPTSCRLDGAHNLVDGDSNDGLPKIASRSSSLSTDTTGSYLSDLDWSSAAPSTSACSYSPLEAAARLKLPSNFDPDTREAIRRAAASILSNSSRSGGGYRETGQSADRAEGPTSAASATPGNLGVLSNQAGLMGDCGNGYFGKRIREKVQAIVLEQLPGCTSAMEEDVISIAEFGASNSLSSSIIKPLVSGIVHQRRLLSDSPTPYINVIHADLPGFDFRSLMLKQSHSSSSADADSSQIFTNFVARPFDAQIVPPRTLSLGYSLMDLHWRQSSTQMGAAAAHSDLQAFLEVRAKEFKQGGLLIVAYIQRRDTQNIVTQQHKRMVTNGQNLGGVEEDLRAPYFPSPIHTPPATIGRGRLSSVDQPSPDLLERTIASNLQRLSSAPLSRNRSGSSPCPPSASHRRDSTAQSDIWSAVPALLAPCIQRLVSTGLIKSDTARRLLSLPLYPRTAAETNAILQNVSHLWSVQHSCGLGNAQASNPPAFGEVASKATPAEEQVVCSPLTPTPASMAAGSAALDECFLDSLIASNLEKSGQADGRGRVEDALLLSHPAHTAFQAGTLSRIQFAEHALHFVRVLYEAHFRTVLKEHARLSRGKLEEVLDALNEVLREKIEESDRAPLPLELECCIYALKRL